MLNGQMAIVTGASRGIGEGILQALAKANATVIGTSTSQRGAEGISAALAGLGAKGAGRVLDVRDAPACAALVVKVQEEFGAVAILVNNAGATRDNLLALMKDADSAVIQQINLCSAYLQPHSAQTRPLRATPG